MAEITPPWGDPDMSPRKRLQHYVVSMVLGCWLIAIGHMFLLIKVVGLNVDMAFWIMFGYVIMIAMMFNSLLWWAKFKNAHREAKKR